MSQKNSILILLILLTLVMIFHILVLSGIIPYTLVWAGKLNSKEQMFAFESVSLFVNFVLMFVLVVRLKNIKQNSPNKLVNAFLWMFVILFAINTIGNLFSKNKVELIFGTALTLVCSILCYFSVKDQHNNQPVS